MSIHRTLALITCVYVAISQGAIVPSYGTWANPGCYPLSPTPLIVSFGFGTPGMTLEKCLDAATQSGYHFAGIANGDHCYAGGIIREPTTLSLSDCNVPCISNSAQTCGGVNRVLIYRNGPVIVPSPYSTILSSHWIGCSSDTGSGLSLRHSVNAAATITTHDCVNACTGLGFVLAGLSKGYLCHCGNALLNNGQLVASSGGACSTGCDGNPYEECGGPNAITVYQNGYGTITTGPGQTVQSYGSWNLLNCYTDSVSSRSLSAQVSFPQENLQVEACLDACNTRGYSLAGLEYGQECFCGNSIQSPGTVAASGCTAMQCVGNANQFCGGPDRVLVYQRTP